MSVLTWLTAGGPRGVDALAAHRERIMYRVGAAAAVCLAPFAVDNLVEGRYVLGVVICIVILTLAVDAVALFADRRPPIPFALLLLPMAVGLLLSLRSQGIYGALWAYPFAVFCYFVLTPRVADVSGVALLVVTTAMVYHYIGEGMAIRFCVSLGLTIVVVNITRTIIRELQTRLLDQAITDPLTNAFNRRHMEACLGDAVERQRRTSAPAALLVIDVDHFKRINDRFGHEAGDGVLKGIVALILRRVRKLDRLFRLGGDEFVLLLPDTRGADAARVAEELRGSVAAARLLNAWPVAVSIGVSGLESGESVESWMKHGDDALYVAKNSGRNRVVSREAAASLRSGQAPDATR